MSCEKNPRAPPHFRNRSGCSHAGLIPRGLLHYQRIGNVKEGGYSSTRLTNDSYSVHYTGTDSSKPEVIYDYALLRSAELTVECGFKYFIVTSDIDRSRGSIRYTPGIPVLRTPSYGSYVYQPRQPNRSGYAARTDYYVSSAPTRGHFSTVKIPKYTLLIKMYAETEGIRAPANLTYEAAPLITKLKTKHGLK